MNAQRLSLVSAGHFRFIAAHSASALIEINVIETERYGN
jgi:hypothetical protein